MRRTKLVAISAWLATFVFSLVYVAHFHSALTDGDWTDVSGFTRIAIPDTFIYKSLIDEEFSIFTIGAAGVKNAIGPALIWSIAYSNWFVVVVLNSLMLLTLLLYVIKLCQYFQVSPARTRSIVLIIGLMPTTAYFSIGALKELPTLLALTAFYFHFIKNQTVRWVLMALILFLFRYQMLIVIFIFLLINKYATHPLRAAALVILITSTLYPFIEKLNILSAETTALYREDSVQSVGALVEDVRSSVPIMSAVAVAIRVVQSILEPLVQLSGNYWFFEGASISILAIAYTLSLLLMLPSWLRTVYFSYQVFFMHTPESRDISLLYALIVLFVILVGGFSFVHHRYLFPISALIMIGGALRPRKTLRRIEF